MRFAQFAALSLLLTTPLMSQGKLHMNSSIPNADIVDVWKDANGKEYTIRRNPQPKEKLQFTLSFIDAPQNLIPVKMYASYVSDCQILVDKLAGAYALINKTFPLTFQKVNDVYQATVYKDLLLNEDMGNTGTICQWQLEGISVNLEPSPNIAMVQYAASLNVSKFTQVAPQYWRRDAYITRWRFNEKIHSMEGIRRTVAAFSKAPFGEKQRQELATIRMELKGTNK